MARKSKQLYLSAAAKAELEREYRKGKTHCYRQRCRMMLLKAEGWRSKDIAAQTGCCEPSVNSWVKRYEQEGTKGLRTKVGRGRKPLLSGGKDEAVVRAVVKEERQRLSKAKYIIETELDKQFSLATLTRFLKLLTAVTNE